MRKRSKSAAARRAAAVAAAVGMTLAMSCVPSGPVGQPLLGITAGAESSGICGDDLSWKLDNEGTLTVIGTGAMYDQPETRWKPLRNSITAIVIESGVTSIGDYAFEGLTNVKSISLPDTLTAIGDEAFCNTGTSAAIDYIYIPDSVVSIGTGAFEMCNADSVRLPAGITAIPDDAFSHSRIRSIVIPENVTEIGDKAFAYCTSLVSAELPEGVVTIGESAFSSCLSLEYLTLPASLEVIGDRALYDCDSLVGISIPTAVKSIGNYAFARCDELEMVYIPDSVLAIGSGMLANDPLLDAVYYSGTQNEWYLVFEPSGLETDDEVRSYLGVDDYVSFVFAASPLLPDQESGLNVKKTSLIPSETFDLDIYIPPCAKKADSLYFTVKFDSGAFEVVSWYSSDTGSPAYIGKYIPDSLADRGANYIALDASAAGADLSEGILLTAKMKVKENASAGGHRIYFEEAGAFRSGHESLWYPTSTSVTLSVSSDSVVGHVSGYGDNKGIVTVTLLDPDGRAVSSMTAVDGDYVFSGLTPGASYSVRASMPRCAPRTVTFTAGDSVTEQDIVLRKYGDVNGDTFVDAKDATQILRYEAGLPSMIKSAGSTADTYLLQVADITGSGDPCSKDATQILRYDVGMTSIFDRLV